MLAMNGLNTSGLALRPEMYSEIKVRSRATLSRLPVAFGPCCCCGVAPATVGPTRAAAHSAASAAVPPATVSRRNDLRLIKDPDVLSDSMNTPPPSLRPRGPQTSLEAPLK